MMWCGSRVIKSSPNLVAMTQSWSESGDMLCSAVGLACSRLQRF